MFAFILDNDFSHIVLTVKEQLIQVHERYDEPVKTSTGITVAYGRIRWLVCVQLFHRSASRRVVYIPERDSLAT